ncbi:hypothetical protein [Halovenus salina]|uniref:Uncharacterized protein n=1 Tax=Halovenus salina TaxID=1510225 RepID=A0ABD5VZ63_9EURY|nr:hypothetical protein [Halovenus salina]
MDDDDAAEKIQGVMDHAEPALREQELADLGAVVDYLRGDDDE